MLWTVRHLWPSGACFVFKCYCHHSSTVLKSWDGMANITHTKEGVTQVDPLAMVAYGIVIFPLIKYLKSTYPDVMQPWYAGKSGALGTFNNLELCFKALNRNRPAQGYNPEPTKSILFVHPQNLEAGEIFGQRHIIKMCKG